MISQRDFGESKSILLAAPTFSPNGQRIAYPRTGGLPILPLQIFTSAVAGSPPVRLLPDTHGSYQGAPTWSADGQSIAFAEWQGKHWALLSASTAVDRTMTRTRRDVGHVLKPVLPDAFVQLRYSYTFAEQIVNIHHDRSNLDVEFGYFLTPRLRVFTMGTGMKTHGGIDLTEVGWRALPANVGRHHDRVGRVDLLDVGGGVQFSVTGSLDLFGSYMKSLAGRNTHALDRAITIGASWSFGRSLRGLIMAADEDPEESLVRCLCQK